MEQQQRNGFPWAAVPSQFHRLNLNFVPHLQQHIAGIVHHHINPLLLRPDLPSFFQPILRLGREIGLLCHAAGPYQPPNPQRIAARRSFKRPGFACLSNSLPGNQPMHLFDIALSQEQVSKTLEGIPVYTVSNAGNEFVLVSDPNGSKSLSLLCFRPQDAESLLSQVRDREPVLGRGAKVVAVSLEKVYKLAAEGIAFRFLPDPFQVKNAVEAKIKSGDKVKVFDGVPVFQSENLILRSSNQRFIPIFFRKEDLERALAKAAKQQKRSNPSLKASMDIQVGSLEDVLKKLELNDENSGWGDFIFIPPGKDAVEHLGKALG